jgi:hypothetical protein
VQPVLDTVAETAARLCGADSAAVSIREGKLYRNVSSSYSAADPERWADVRQRTVVPGRDSIAGRVLLEGRVVHVEDIRADPDYAFPGTVAAGRRTTLGVPLLHDSEPIGVISLNRQRVEPFTERQKALVRTFADQAVIAMENARLLGELQARTHDLTESLEYQTATSDVLNVISRSTADVQPVLDTVIETAARLCNADHGGLTIREGEVYRYVASTQARIAAEPEMWATARQRTIAPGRDSVAGLGRPRRQGRACRRRPRHPGLRPARGCKGRDPYHPGRAAAARGNRARHDKSRKEAGRTVHRAADRTGAHLCRPGGHRDGKCAAARRIAGAHARPRRVARIPDRDQ